MIIFTANRLRGLSLGNLILLLLAGTLLLPATAAAFESDVHFGLTQWLALKAGFTQQEADALATGDQRVDSGDMQFIELAPAYAPYDTVVVLAERIESNWRIVSLGAIVDQ